MLRMNLQFFSTPDDGGGTGDPAPTDNPGGNNDPSGTGNPETKPEDTKTFTQDDVNSIAAREAKKAQEKLFKELGIEDFDNAKEGMKKFQEWQEAQKTDAEKQAEKLQNLEKDSLEKDKTIKTLEARLSARNAGVVADSVEDVVALAERLVSEETSIDDAIKQVIEKYPHFAEEPKEEEPGKPSISTGTHSRKSPTNLDPFQAKLDKYK